MPRVIIMDIFFTISTLFIKKLDPYFVVSILLKLPFVLLSSNLCSKIFSYGNVFMLSSQVVNLRNRRKL